MSGHTHRTKSTDADESTRMHHMETSTLERDTCRIRLWRHRVANALEILRHAWRAIREREGGTGEGGRSERERERAQGVGEALSFLVP